jgi:hypothetical protein
LSLAIKLSDELKPASIARIQGFLLWTPEGVVEIRDAELTRREQEEVWQELRTKCPKPECRGQYGLYHGQEELHWTDLPTETVVNIPKKIPLINREGEFDTRLNESTQGIRTDGRLSKARC